MAVEDGKLDLVKSDGITVKLNHLRDVIAVAERGSLRSAARQLGLAQPAITRSIRELEHELGVSLFERRVSGMILTPMGKAFLRRAVGIQRELQRTRDEIRAAQGQDHGKHDGGAVDRTASGVAAAGHRAVSAAFSGRALAHLRGTISDYGGGIFRTAPSTSTSAG